MKWISKLETGILIISISLATIFASLNVFFRMMGEGITWSEELVRYLIIWLTFIGASACIKDNSHIAIESIPQLVKGRLKKILDNIIHIICILFSLLFTFYSLKFLHFTIGKLQVAPSLGIPMYIIYLVLPLSGLLMSIRYSQKVLPIIKEGDI